MLKRTRELQDHCSLKSVVSSFAAKCSANEDAGTTGGLDSLLSGLGEKLGLDDHWDLWHQALTENLNVSLCN